MKTLFIHFNFNYWKYFYLKYSLILGFLFTNILNTRAQEFSIDTTFKINYDFYNPYSNFPTIYGMSEEQNGKLMIYGDFTDSSYFGNAIRIYQNGTVDNSFYYPWPDGVKFIEQINNEYLVYTFNVYAKFDYYGNVDTAWTINTMKDDKCGIYHYPYIFQDGSLFVGADTCNMPDSKTRFFKRLLPNGRMDTNFCHRTNGLVFGFLKYSNDKLLLYSTGSNGFTRYDTVPIIRMCRIDTLGNLDTTFKSIFTNGNSLIYTSPVPLFVQNDDKIIVAGASTTTYNNTILSLLRLNPNGSLDTTFNNFNTISFLNGEGIKSVCPTSDNGYLIGGSFTHYQGYLRNNICKTDINGFIDTNYFKGEGLDSVFTPNSILPIVCNINKGANDTYYVMGYFNYYNGVHVNPIFRIKGLSAGINEIKQENLEIKIYPNPTKDNLTIETNINTKQKLEIINILGQNLYTSNIYSKTTINTSAFAKGVYILKLSTDKITIIKKFIKQ